MDLDTVTSYRFARTRDELALSEGETVLAGGTWLLSEPQLSTTGLVDLSEMGWPAIEYLDSGVRIAATCTITELVTEAASAMPEVRPEWRSAPLFGQCADALLASWKIWQLATVGGNVCRSFAAGAMVSLCVALDGDAVVWRPDGSDYRIPVAELVTGNGTNTLRAGEVLRALELPEHALRARTAMRKIALATLGRSGAVLTGRVDENSATTFTITAATARPTVLRYPALPSPARLHDDVVAADGYYTDPLGTADWRRQVSVVLTGEIRDELAAGR